MQITALYIHQQDFVDGLIGPFTTTQSINAHLSMQRARGDGADTIGLYCADDREFIDLVKSGCLLLTPEQDSKLDYPFQDHGN